MRIQEKSDITQAGDAAAFGPSPGLERRFRMAANWHESLDKLGRALHQAPLPQPVHQKCTELLAIGTPSLNRLCRLKVQTLPRLPIQLCIRDLWYDHLLFDNSQVAGIIDFGSTGDDCVATDLARLLRSWFPGEGEDFNPALDAYSAIHPLSKAERESFHWFDRTSRVLSAFQWIEWLAIQQRQFDDWEAVFKRLDFVLERLPPP
jgi:Ser/Thr protein kinase RdoA (MazF antagonist)